VGDTSYPRPWAIEALICELTKGDSLDKLVCRGGQSGRHDKREHQLEDVFGDILIGQFRRSKVIKRKRINDTLGVTSACFPGACIPDVVLSRDGLMHICELKSNRIDYPRDDQELTPTFRAYLNSIGHRGSPPREVEQDLIKLHLYATLSPNVGSCLFLMVDAYQGGGRLWTGAFSTSYGFLQTMRTALVRSWADRLLTSTQLVPLRCSDTSATLIVCEVGRGAASVPVANDS
jgi:hypothetical protein